MAVSAAMAAQKFSFILMLGRKGNGSTGQIGDLGTFNRNAAFPARYLNIGLNLNDE